MVPALCSPCFAAVWVERPQPLVQVGGVLTIGGPRLMVRLSSFFNRRTPSELRSRVPCPLSTPPIPLPVRPLTSSPLNCHSLTLALKHRFARPSESETIARGHASTPASCTLHAHPVSHPFSLCPPVSNSPRLCPSPSLPRPLMRCRPRRWWRLMPSQLSPPSLRCVPTPCPSPLPGSSPQSSQQGAAVDSCAYAYAHVPLVLYGQATFAVPPSVLPLTTLPPPRPAPSPGPRSGGGSTGPRPLSRLLEHAVKASVKSSASDPVGPPRPTGQPPMAPQGGGRGTSTQVRGLARFAF